MASFSPLENSSVNVGKNIKQEIVYGITKKKCSIHQEEKSQTVCKKEDLDVIDKEFLIKMLLSNQDILKTAFENMNQKWGGIKRIIIIIVLTIRPLIFKCF